MLEGARRAGTVRAHWPLALPAVAVALLCVVLDRWTNYHSDSVAQQALVRTWLDHGHGTAYVPVDTWILKLPVYLVFELLPLDPGWRLLGGVVALNVLCLAALAPAAWVLARSAWRSRAAPRAVDVVLPLVWLATLGGELGMNRMQPNYRNIELGLAFLALAVAARELDGRPDRGPREPSTGRAPGTGPRWASARAVVTAAGGAVLLALLWVDDPYFALLTGLPFGVLALLWSAWTRRIRYAAGGLVTLASLALIEPFQRVLGAWGLQIIPGGGDAEFTLQRIRTNLALLWPAVQAQLGLADTDPYGAVPGTGTWVAGPAAVLTLALVALAVVAGVGLTVNGLRRRLLLPTFLGVHWVLVAAGFCVSTMVVQVAHGRYLILAFYDLAVTLAVVLPALRRRFPAAATAIGAGLAVSAVLNVAASVATAPDDFVHMWDRRNPYEAGPSDPATQRAIQDAVASTGLTRGYAAFWQANLTLYRSGGKASVNSVQCTQDGTIWVENWLTDTARRTAPSPAGTFLVYEPGSPAFFGCPADVLRATLGAPDRTVEAGPTAQVWVWNRDIAPRIRTY